MSDQGSKGSKQDLSSDIQFPMLAIDHGARFIGLAISDVNGKISAPYDTLRKKKNKDNSYLIEQIRQICKEEGVRSILLGIPQNFDENYDSKSEEIMKFGERLMTECEVDLCYYDESFSTVEAEQILDVPHRRAKRSGMIDQTSAAIFLQDFLDNRNGTSKK